MSLINEIKILSRNNIKIVSAGTHMFIDNDKSYAIRYRKISNYILIDLYVIDDNGKPSDIRIGSSEYSPSLWSKVLTSISEYIYYNSPITIKIACSDKKLIKFYDHMFIYIRRFREFNGYVVSKEDSEDGAVYTISKDIKISDPDLDECIKKYLNEI